MPSIAGAPIAPGRTHRSGTATSARARRRTGRSPRGARCRRAAAASHTCSIACSTGRRKDGWKPPSQLGRRGRPRCRPPGRGAQAQRGLTGERTVSAQLVYQRCEEPRSVRPMIRGTQMVPFTPHSETQLMVLWTEN